MSENIMYDERKHVEVAVDQERRVYSVCNTQ